MGRHGSACLFVYKKLFIIMSYKYTKGSVKRGDLKAESSIDSDGNTYVDFGDDSVGLVAGGVDFIKATEAAQDILVINEAGVDVDFRVESSGEDEAIFLNAGNDTLHINKGSSAFATTIYGNSGNALEVNSSGVTINEAGAAANDFRVESDTKTHMLFVDAGNNEIGINTSDPTSMLSLSGSLSLQVTETTSDLTLSNSHFLVSCGGSSALTITLPAISGCLGRVYYIANNTNGGGGADVTIDGNSSETIGGETTKTFGSGQGMMIMAKADEWQILVDNTHE